jgi:hypothetical protein
MQLHGGLFNVAAYSLDRSYKLLERVFVTSSPALTCVLGRQAGANKGTRSTRSLKRSHCRRLVRRVRRQGYDEFVYELRVRKTDSLMQLRVARTGEIQLHGGLFNATDYSLDRSYNLLELVFVASSPG